MRARLAIASSGLTVELREILLRDKAPEFIAASGKATVPVLVLPDRVIDESFDVMLWALKRADPEGWLKTPGLGFDLIAECDGPFKTALDRLKYAVRYDDVDTALEQHNAGLFLHQLNRMLEHGPFLFGADATLADYAILPFVRQFAHTDINWWDDQPFSNTQNWLAAFKASDRFASIMTKYTPWKSGDDVVLFP
jgi:glutathione S-transferase